MLLYLFLLLLLRLYRFLALFCLGLVCFFFLISFFFFFGYSKCFWWANCFSRLSFCSFFFRFNSVHCSVASWFSFLFCDRNWRQDSLDQCNNNSILELLLQVTGTHALFGFVHWNIPYMYTPPPSLVSTAAAATTQLVMDAITVLRSFDRLIVKHRKIHNKIS